MTTVDERWAEYVGSENLFSNAIRLRYLIWTIERHAAPGARLLETGFGSGATAVLLADLGYSVAAVDLSADVVRQMEERYNDWTRQGRLEIRHGNMLELPWGDGEFDVAYHQGVLEHLPDDQIVAALREQGRVARCVIFDVPNDRYGERPFGDERLLSVRVWRRLIARAGLKVEETLGRGFPWWAYLLPYGLFARRGVASMPLLSQRIGTVSIFVCSSRERK